METRVIKNPEPFTILVTVDCDQYVVPAAAWLQVGPGDDVYLTHSGDAPMRAFPVRRATRDLCRQSPESLH